jgi:HNH endonuclease
MAMKEITRREILLAIDECKGLTKAELYDKYGFRQARSYILIHDGERYDSKAVVGIAHRFVPGSNGPLLYTDFGGGGPVKRLLEKLDFEVSVEHVGPLAISAEEGDKDPFDPDDVADGRRHIRRTITQRRGQKTFRDALIDAYGGRCAITRCKVRDVLEAAHIFPYLGEETNHVTNGLLLRADLHTLFDLGFIAIDPKTFSILVARGLHGGEYGRLHGKKLHLPKRRDKYPSKKALEEHRRDAAL